MRYAARDEAADRGRARSALVAHAVSLRSLCRVVLGRHARSRRVAELRCAPARDRRRSAVSHPRSRMRPGRDLAWFRSQGHDAVGLDARRASSRWRASDGLRGLAPRLSCTSRSKAGVPRNLRERLALPRAASELPRVLRELRAALGAARRPLASNPRGETARVGMAIVTARITRSRAGVRISSLLASTRSSTTIVRPAARARSSRGSRRCFGKWAPSSEARALRRRRVLGRTRGVGGAVARRDRRIRETISASAHPNRRRIPQAPPS